MTKDSKRCVYRVATGQAGIYVRASLLETIPDKEVEVNTFQRRIIKYRQHLFTFLYHLEVPPDNNTSERAVRNVKIKQKVSGLFKSEKGAQIYAVVRPITDTRIKNGQGIM
ncbi:MAG: IS66 family transposase [Daejeonella sp.]